MRKQLNVPVLLIVLVAIVLVFGTNYWLSNNQSSLPNVAAKAAEPIPSLPDFTLFTDVQTKKETFFELLYPIIQEENAHVLSVRKALLGLQQVDALSNSERQWISEVAEYYKIENDDDTPVEINQALIDELLVRIDYVPPSLALTQAAIESGWGTSRFSREGNNLFGHWCFVKGCGIVPSDRDEGRYHEVAKFSTVNQAVRAYLRNLNTHYAYEEFRDLRAQLRNNNKPLTGKALANSLGHYSEEGEHYIQKVSRFIDHNKLQRYTRQFEEAVIQTESQSEATSAR